MRSMYNAGIHFTEWTLAGKKVTQSSTLDEAGDWTWNLQSGAILGMEGRDLSSVPLLHPSAQGSPCRLFQGLQYTLVNNGSICHVSQIQHDFYPIAVPPAAHMLGRGDLAGEMAVLSYGMLIGKFWRALMLFGRGAFCCFSVRVYQSHSITCTPTSTPTGNSSDAGMMLFVAEDTCLPAYVIAKGGGQTALTT